MSTDDQRVIDERRKAFYEADFNPGHATGRMPTPDVRIAMAAEYIAFQLGQINRKIDKLMAMAGILAGGE